jgi:hypothetical protein
MLYFGRVGSSCRICAKVDNSWRENVITPNNNYIVILAFYANLLLYIYNYAVIISIDLSLKHKTVSIKYLWSVWVCDFKKFDLKSRF